MSGTTSARIPVPRPKKVTNERKERKERRIDPEPSPRFGQNDAQKEESQSPAPKLNRGEISDAFAKLEQKYGSKIEPSEDKGNVSKVSNALKQF